MTCKKCLRFPVPTSNYDEVTKNITMQSDLYRCRTCGQLIQIFLLERGIHYLSLDEARIQFPDADI